MHKLSPDLIVDVTLCATKDGGRQTPLRGDLHPWFSCPCKARKDDYEGWDCRLLIDGVVFEPGETRRLGILFLSREQAVPMFFAASHFFLWEGHVIGEALVVEAVQKSSFMHRFASRLVRSILLNSSIYERRDGQEIEGRAKAAFKAEELAKFARLYARKAYPQRDPNDRHFDLELQAKIRRMKPEELDALLRDGLNEE